MVGKVTINQFLNSTHETLFDIIAFGRLSIVLQIASKVVAEESENYVTFISVRGALWPSLRVFVLSFDYWWNFDIMIFQIVLHILFLFFWES